MQQAKAGLEIAEKSYNRVQRLFDEGVISPTVVMEAQTAWMKAQSQKIDAEIDVKLSQVDLQKALGTLE